VLIMQKNNQTKHINGQPLTATEMTLADAYRKSKARKIIFRFACVIGAIVLVIWGVSPWGYIAFNTTNSIDGYVFFVRTDLRPDYRQIAAFHPPKNKHYHEKMWFGKYVVGMGGDEVAVEGRQFYINGTYIGTAKEFARNGNPLTMSTPGVIPQGYYFMWTDHESSYDSRYSDIGWIHESDIFGRVYKLL